MSQLGQPLLQTTHIDGIEVEPNPSFYKGQEFQSLKLFEEAVRLYKIQENMG